MVGYSGKRFNLNGYVCLQYSLLWGVLGTASVLWLNGLLLRLCQAIPSWLLHPLVWAAVIVAALDQIVRPCWWGTMRPNTRCWNS